LILVRELTATDASALRQLRMEALRTAPTAFGASYEESKGLTDEDFRKRIEGAAPGATFGAFDGDALVGMAGVFLESGMNSRHKGFMWGVFVRGTHRGQGVARSLVQAVIAKARGIAVVLNSAVVTDNTRAAALYAGLGFKTYGIERKALCVDGVFYDEALIAIDFTEA
jgi:GNAT superfamily N-acetyltransferase